MTANLTKILSAWCLLFSYAFLESDYCFFMCHQISKDTITACQGISFKSWMTPKYIWKPFLLKRGKRSKTLKVFKIESESPKEVRDGWMEKKSELCKFGLGMLTHI